MPNYVLPVPFGSDYILVGADDLRTLGRRIRYVKELHKRSEVGETTPEAHFDSYVTNDNDEYFGFRRPDGAFINFGVIKQPKNEEFEFYLVRPDYKPSGDTKAQGYRGYQHWDSEAQSLVPADPLPLEETTEETGEEEDTRQPEAKVRNPKHPGTHGVIQGMLEAKGISEAGVKFLIAVSTGHEGKTLEEIPSSDLRQIKDTLQHESCNPEEINLQGIGYELVARLKAIKPNAPKPGKEAAIRRIRKDMEEMIERDLRTKEAKSKARRGVDKKLEAAQQ